MIDPSFQEALAAVVEFNANLLIIFAIVTVIKKDLSSERSNDFLAVLGYMMNRIYRPLVWLMARVKLNKPDAVPLVFLAVIVPAQILLVALLRSH